MGTTDKLYKTWILTGYSKEARKSVMASGNRGNLICKLYLLRAEEQTDGQRAGGLYLCILHVH